MAGHRPAARLINVTGQRTDQQHVVDTVRAGFIQISKQQYGSKARRDNMQDKITKATQAVIDKLPIKIADLEEGVEVGQGRLENQAGNFEAGYLRFAGR